MAGARLFTREAGGRAGGGRGQTAGVGGIPHPRSLPPSVKYERIKFLVIALKNSVEVYAWAPKPYHKFMAFKVTPPPPAPAPFKARLGSCRRPEPSSPPPQSFADLPHRPLLVDLTVEEGQRLKVIYGSSAGFHAVDVDSGNSYDIYIPVHVSVAGLRAEGGRPSGPQARDLQPPVSSPDPEPDHAPRHHLPPQHGRHGDAAVLRGRGRLRQHVRAHHQGRGAAVGRDAHLCG